MAEIYLEPLIIVVATILVLGMIAFFDFLPPERRTAKSKKLVE